MTKKTMGMYTMVSEGGGGISGGQIVDNGGYDELIGRNGCFAELAGRQRVEAVG